MATVAESLRDAETRLAEESVAESGRQAASLLGFVLKKDKTFLIAHPEYELTDAEAREFASVIGRRATHEPFQYIVGVQEFYGLEFRVTPDVLIPRPETEMVVERAITLLQHQERPRFCEVGVGSGCISVAILRHVKNSTAVGLETSRAAIEVAKRNAIVHDVGDRLRLLESDVFSALQDEKFNIIAANPPYVPAGDLQGLQAEVRDFEPSGALTDGGNGLAIIERIAEGSPGFLEPKGYLLMEIGFSQSPAVRQMFDSSRWRSVEFLPDLQGIPRLVQAQIR